MSESEERCPDCGERVSFMEVLYGFPTSCEFPGCVYGGEHVTIDSPTHCCELCGAGVHVPGFEHRWHPFPSKCYFCGDLLCDSDKLKFSMDFEEWLVPSQDGIRLTDSIFERSLYPVCATCRQGIDDNLGGIEADLQAETRDGRNARRLYLIGFLAFVLLGFIVWLKS